MKKLKIYDKEKSLKEEDDIIFLKLCPNENNNDIRLIACDKYGKKILGGELITIDMDLMCIVVHSNISRDIPMKKSLKDEIIFATEEFIHGMMKEEHMRQMTKRLSQSVMENVCEKEENVKH